MRTELRALEPKWIRADICIYTRLSFRGQGILSDRDSTVPRTIRCHRSSIMQHEFTNGPRCTHTNSQIRDEKTGEAVYPANSNNFGKTNSRWRKTEILIKTEETWEMISIGKCGRIVGVEEMEWVGLGLGRCIYDKRQDYIKLGTMEAHSQFSKGKEAACPHLLRINFLERSCVTTCRLRPHRTINDLMWVSTSALVKGRPCRHELKLLKQMEL